MYAPMTCVQYMRQRFDCLVFVKTSCDVDEGTKKKLREHEHVQERLLPRHEARQLRLAEDHRRVGEEPGQVKTSFFIWKLLFKWSTRKLVQLIIL